MPECGRALEQKVGATAGTWHHGLHATTFPELTSCHGVVTVRYVLSFCLFKAKKGGVKYWAEMAASTA